MATIVLSDAAPKDAKSFSLANANIDVPHETTDSTILANAESHPWLRVEADKASLEVPAAAERHVAPEDDPLSSATSVANDPDAVKAAFEESVDLTPLAVEAGLDQDESVKVGEVAVTLAADDGTDDKPARKSRGGAKE